MERDEDKTKAQLMTELVEMRQRITELDASQADRKQAEKALWESNKFKQLLMESFPNKIFFKDTSSVYTFCNSHYASDLGISPEEIRGKTDYDFYPRDLADKYRADDQRIIASGQLEQIEEPYKIGDEERMVLTVKTPVRDADGSIIGILGIFTDITDRKQAEEALKESEQRFRDIAENALEWVWETNADGKYTYASPVVEKILGYKPEEVLGKHFFDLFLPEEREQSKKAALEVFAKKQPLHEFVNRNIHKNGETVWLSTSGVPMLDEEGNLLGYRGADIDITERKRAEEALQESEERFRSVVENSHDGILIVDEAYRFIYVNDELCRISEYSREEIIGQDFRKFLDEESKQLVAERYIRRQRGEKVPPRYEFNIVRKSGEKRRVEISSTIIKDSAGKVKTVSQILDITERKQAEEALEESEEKYRTLFTESRDAIFITTLDGKLIDANQSYLDLFGHTREEALGLDVRETYVNPDDRLRYQQEMEQKGAVRDFELKLRKKDGTELDCLLTATVRQNKDGGILGYQGIIRDITEHKRAEEDLIIAEQNFRHSLDNSPLGVHIVTAEGELLYANQAMLDIYSYNSVEELKNTPIKERYTPESYAEFHKRSEKRKQGKPTPDSYEVSIIRKDGEVRYLIVSRKPVVWNGEIHYQTLYQDITERKQMEEALVDEATRRRILVEQSRDGIVILDQNGKVYEANQQFAEMLGYSPEETAQLHVWDWDTQWTKEQLLEMLQSIDAAGDHFQTYHRRKDGTVYDVEISTNGAIIAGQKLVFCVCRDITERKQAEENLRESEEFNSSLLNNSPIPIHVVNPDTSIRFVNTALEKLTGFSSAEVIDRRAPYPWWPEETLRKTFRDFREAMHKGAERVEKLFQKKNGERFWVEITGTPVMNNGELRYYLASWFDITERKLAEEREKEMQQQLIVTSRLASIGEMASGIAHEINNPLTGVIGYAQLLREKNIPQDIKEAVDVISEGGQRVADIVQKLLTFARKTKAEKEYVDINSILTSILEMRSYEIKTSNIKLTSQLAPDLPWTMANIGQLQQVFLNIVVNAEQAMTEAHAGGRLRVKTEMINNSIRVSIADNGPGIAKEYIDRLFDPFSTTKDGGTGLGLSISYGIIKEHKGKLYAKSTLGKGATFIVELPIVAESKQLEMAEPPSQEPERVTGARIMVVDDEPTVCQFLNQVLTQEGHKVETILGSQTAFQRMNIAQYDLFLLDIKMSVISGIDLYRSMKEIDPSLQRKVIFIAGEIISPKTKAFLTKTRIPCLTKPFDLEQLRKEINRKLRQGA